MARAVSSDLLRLYVVHHKAATESQLTSLFNQLPGMVYCDLKRDHSTGLSRVLVYHPLR
jgi:hypothetical protein